MDNCLRSQYMNFCLTNTLGFKLIALSSNLFRQQSLIKFTIHLDLEYAFPKGISICELFYFPFCSIKHFLQFESAFELE